MTTSIGMACRSLRRSAGLTVSCVLCLGLGFGACYSLALLVDALVLKDPVGVTKSDELARLYFSRFEPGRPGTLSTAISYPQLVALKEARGLSGLAGFRITEQPIDLGFTVRSVVVAAVERNYFSLLGAKPFMGSLFGERGGAPSDDASRGVVLSYELWTSVLGRDPSILTRSIRIRRSSFRVVAVAQRHFSAGEGRPPDMWVLLDDFAPEIAGMDWRTNSESHWIGAVARMNLPKNVQSEARELTAVLQQTSVVDESADSSTRVVLGPIQEERGPRRSQATMVAIWAATASSLALLIAALNVAGLLVLRAIERRKEFQIRRLLGANARDILAPLLTEGFLLNAAGAAVGVALAIATRGVAAYLLGVSEGVNGGWPSVLAVVGACAMVLLSGTLCVFVPYLQASRTDARMPQGHTTIGLERRSSNIRTALVVAQVSLSMILLFAAGLFWQSLRQVRNLDLGIEPHRVALAGFDFRDQASMPPEIDEILERIATRLRRLPSIEGASVAIAAPFRSSLGVWIHVPGGFSLPDLRSGTPYMNAITPEFFKTLGTRLMAGRGFSSTDRAGSPRVAIVNQTMAHLVWAGASPLGRCIQLGNALEPCVEVVGIVADARRNRVIEDTVMQFYVPLNQNKMEYPTRTLLVRSRGDASQILPLLRREVASQAGLPVPDVATLDDLVEPQVRQWALGTRVFSVISLLCLTTAFVGLLGLVGYAIRERSREFALRLAVGAQRTHLRRIVFGHCTRIGVVAAVIGAVPSLLLGRLVAALLYGVKPYDVVSMLTASAIVVSVAVLAGVSPYNRLVRLAPAEVLRSE